MKTKAVLLAVMLVGAAWGAPSPISKITREQATKTALDRVPGASIESSELETEGGKTVWSFDLRAGKTLREVQVDAGTGLIVDDKVETPKQERDEKAKDKAEAKARAKAKKVKKISPVKKAPAE